MEYSELPALPSAQSSQEATPQWQHPIPGYGMTPPNRPSIDLQRFGHQSGYQVPTSSRDPIRFGHEFSSNATLSSGQIPTLNCNPSSAFEVISHGSSANSEGGQTVSRKSTLMQYRMDIEEGTVKSKDTKHVLPTQIETQQSKPFSDDQTVPLDRDATAYVTGNKGQEQTVASIFSHSSLSKKTASDIGRNPHGIATTSTKISDDFNIHDGNRPLSSNSGGESKSCLPVSDKSSTSTKETCNYGNLISRSSSVEAELTQRISKSPETEANQDNKAVIGYSWCPDNSFPNEKPSTSIIESSNLQDDTSNYIIRHAQSSNETISGDVEHNMKDGRKPSPCSSPMNDDNQFEIPPLPAIKIRSSRRGPFKAASTTKDPVQTSKQPSETTESSSTDLLPFVKQEPKENPNSGSKITEIINICEKHVFGQTSSIQTILNLCSQATGFPGCERFCSQIITICNQLLSETYQNSHSIIDLCKNLTNLDLTGGKKKKDTGRQAKEPVNTSRQTTFTEPDFADDESDLEETEDTKDGDFDWKEILQNSDSEDGLNQEDDPDWSAYWGKKQKTRSRRSDAKARETKEAKPKRLKITVPKLEEKVYEQDENVDDSKEADEEKEESTFEEPLSEDEEPVEPKKKKKKSRGKKSKSEPKPKPNSPNVKGEFKCSDCSKVFLTQRGYEKHESHHRNGFRITCEVCGVACPSPSHFKSHMRTHTGEKPYVCEVCGNSYAQMSTLKGHMLLHSDDRPAQCEYCEYNCKSEKRLRRHMIVHTSDKKFQCEDCGARFLRSASLKKHLQIHKDVWPFSCELCPKRFKSKVHLRRHEEVHRDEYKYQCPVCGKRIRQAGNLKTHMRTHNGEKPYKCESCGKGFAHNVTRKQHQEQCRGHVEVLIQPPTENDYSKYNPALYMVGLKSLAHLS